MDEGRYDLSSLTLPCPLGGRQMVPSPLTSAAGMSNAGHTIRLPLHVGMSTGAAEAGPAITASAANTGTTRAKSFCRGDLTSSSLQLLDPIGSDHWKLAAEPSRVSHVASREISGFASPPHGEPAAAPPEWRARRPTCGVSGQLARLTCPSTWASGVREWVGAPCGAYQLPLGGQPPWPVTVQLRVATPPADLVITNAWLLPPLVAFEVAVTV